MRDTTAKRREIELDLSELLENVDHSAKSNVKYRSFESYLADLISIDPNLIYTTYISKAGNAAVRFDQSKRSRRARVLVGLLDPPPGELEERSVEALVRYAGEQRSDAEFLLFARRRGEWAPSVVIHSRSRKEPSLHQVIDIWNLHVIETSAARSSRSRESPLAFHEFDPDTELAPIPSPGARLTRDAWDDFGYKTLFTLTLNLDDRSPIEIGEVKILRRGQKKGATLLPRSPFRGLGQDFCSLGQSYSYYENLKQLPKNTYRTILRSLRDVVYDSRIAAAFEDESGFDTSLLRTGTAARALQDAPALFLEAQDEAPSRGMKFTFSTTVGGNRFSIDFAFNEATPLPDRINAIIGYNGTGKTQLLANIALVATGDLEQRRSFEEFGSIVNSEDIRFSSVIAISYSAFDTYVLPDAFWRTEEAHLARQRLLEKGDVFGYTYCGLRKRAPGQSLKTRELKGLKSIDEITDEFSRALELARSVDKRPVLLDALSVIGSEPSFGRTGLVPYRAKDGDAWRENFKHLSTGHKIVLNIITQVLAHSEPGSLILIDEPESHLHPSLLAALLKALNMILRRLDSYAIVATHSPVVIQEIPRRYVRILQRFGNKTSVLEPISETFGENVGYLTSNVFHLDSTQTDYHSILEGLLAGGMSISDIEALFDDEMSPQARAYLLSLMSGGRINLRGGGQ